MQYNTNIHENKQQTASNLLDAQLFTHKPNFYLPDNRPHSIIQKKQVDAIQQNALQKKENNTGLPNQLKTVIGAV